MYLLGGIRLGLNLYLAQVLRVIDWPLLSINKSLASLGCLKSVEQCFIFLAIRLWIFYFPFVILGYYFIPDCNIFNFCFRCAYKLCGLTMMISITSLYPHRAHR
ncbi:hypothetical protein HanXRQr2_Chr11g0514551 [Helianthus annuus]|nr:hypothetical protein HanXRQr2_Chr11g0514551 [Helianthus annuus]KAJ0877070.1 hypothetical protein HanPSC8_Chr11g0495871 [Helianthus annuus]